MATVRAAPKTKPAREGTTTLLLIGLFKLLKGLLLIAVGVGAIKLLHRDVAQTVTHWINVLRVDPDNRLIHGLLRRVFQVSPNQLKALSVGTFVFAGLYLTEGTGLLLRKRWAEYFTLITTAGLIPLEIYEMTRHLTVAKIAVLAVNAAIVAYLIVRGRRGRSADAQAED
jgi:uncharacterized membrane protein (DUF2068 family)